MAKIKKISQPAPFENITETQDPPNIQAFRTFAPGASMRDAALTDLDEAEGLALAEGDERLQALKLAQLEALAGLTARRKQPSYNTGVVQPQGSNIGSSLISGGATAGAAAIIA